MSRAPGSRVIAFATWLLALLGLMLRQRRTTPPAPKRKTLPRGSGSFAVIRALVGFSGVEDEEPGATALAAQAGISQPRASQILHHLHELELVDRSGHGRWEPRREALLDRFLAEYPGPGGSQQYYYSLNSPVDIAVRAGQVSAPGRPIMASADVGPDLILPWRRPSLAILYTKHVIDPAGLGLTQAQGSHDANVIMRTPQDRSVFPTPILVAQVQGSDVPLADRSASDQLPAARTAIVWRATPAGLKQRSKALPTIWAMRSAS
jgi:hypothetical protein